MANPLFNIDDARVLDGEPMTVNGAVNKTFILLACVFIAACYTWFLALNGYTDKAQLLTIGGAIGGFILAMIIIFTRSAMNILTPLYSQLILTYYQTNFIQVELNYYANVTQTELKQNTLILPLGLSVSYILPYYFEFLGIDANNENSLSWYSDSTYENPVFIIGPTTNVLFAEWQISFEGEGNENSPYLITNSYDLILLSSLINSASLNQFYATKVYKLTNNIDLSNFQFTPIGLYPSLPFKGVFLGNNKTISGVYINLPNYSNVGLFGYTTNAKITNLYLTDVFVEAYSIVGGLIGKADNCDVLNCVIEVSVQCYNDNAGALIGMMLNKIKMKKISIPMKC